MTIGNPQGSDFTKMLLDNDFKDILCCASNNSDHEAMKGANLIRVTDFANGSFVDDVGELWQFTVPVKISRLTQMDL